jgi:hypothetical protein
VKTGSNQGRADAAGEWAPRRGQGMGKQAARKEGPCSQGGKDFLSQEFIWLTNVDGLTT